MISLVTYGFGPSGETYKITTFGFGGELDSVITLSFSLNVSRSIELELIR